MPLSDVYLTVKLDAGIPAVQTSAISIWAGNTLAMEVTAKGQDSELIDLTGRSLEYVLWSPDLRGTKKADLTIGHGITIDSDQVNARGQFTILLPGSATSALPIGTLYHEVVMGDGNGHYTTILYGNPTIQASGVSITTP